MKKDFGRHLCCPSCKRELNLLSFSETNGRIKHGILICSCKNWYPIINSVPRLVLGKYRGDYSDFLKKWRKTLSNLKIFDLKIDERKITNEDPTIQTQSSFSNKWASQPKWGLTGPTKDIMRTWILNKYGWKTEEGFREHMKNKKMILDAGTGLGREVINFAKANPDAQVVGMDLSNSVDDALENTKHLPNSTIIQADLTHLPFKDETFDFIFSEGVLHHTPDTERAFKSLVKILKSGGEIAIYVYVKKVPLRELADDYIRSLTTKMDSQECWEVCKGITDLGRQLSDLNVEIKISQNIPILGIKKGRYNLQHFLYYHFLKMYWNDKLSFDENNLINFDWYHPAYAWRHTPDEVKNWYKEAGCKIKWFDMGDSGITVRGVKLT